MSISLRAMKSLCTRLSTSTRPQGYCRPLTLLPLTSITLLLPTTAYGTLSCKHSTNWVKGASLTNIMCSVMIAACTICDTLFSNIQEYSGVLLLWLFTLDFLLQLYNKVKLGRTAEAGITLLDLIHLMVECDALTDMQRFIDRDRFGPYTSHCL